VRTLGEYKLQNRCVKRILESVFLTKADFFYLSMQL